MKKLLKITFFISAVLLILYILITVTLARNNIFLIPSNLPTLSGERCEQLKSSADRGICYSSAANKTGDESLCEKITQRDNRDLCYSNVARNWKKPNLCNKAGSEQEFCINEYAKFNKDYSICTLHTNKDLAQRCRALVN